MGGSYDGPERRDEHRDREQRALDLAVQVAVRNSQVDAQLQESRARLDKINGSIDRFNAHLAANDQRLEKMERAFGEWTAVAKAIEDKGVSTRAFLLATAAVFVPLVVLVVNTLGAR